MAQPRFEPDTYGPHAALVMALCERVDRLSEDEVERLSAAREDRDPDAVGAATSELSELDFENDMWGYNAANAAGAACMPHAHYASGVVEHAASALAYVDQLSKEDFEALYGPWAMVVGVPIKTQADVEQWRRNQKESAGT